MVARRPISNIPRAPTGGVLRHIGGGAWHSRVNDALIEVKVTTQSHVEIQHIVMTGIRQDDLTILELS
jgi:hypothetical protein